MRIGITGGAGFIGSNLARSLVHQGHKIRIIDDFSSGLVANITDLDCEVVQGSFADVDKVWNFLDGVEFVFHLGARGSVPRSIVSPQRTFDVNVVGTQNLLEAIRKLRVPFVFSSSSSVYGNNRHLPKAESLVLDPITPYAASKAASEHMIQAYAKSYDLDCRIFRFFNVFGPRQRPDSAYSAVIPKWIWAALHNNEIQIFGDGEQLRDFTYIEDVVTILSHSITRTHTFDSPINLAFGKPISLNLIVEILRNWFPEMKISFQPPRNGDVQHSYSDSEKLNAYIPNFSPTPLKHGLEKTIEWLSTELGKSVQDFEGGEQLS